MPDYLKYGDKGEKVRVLQRRLNDNRYRTPKRKLEVDGDFGPLTSGAIVKVKYAAGYPQEELKPIAGQFLMSILSGTAPLPPDYKIRREKRLAPDPLSPMDAMRVKVLARIKGELGTLEQPNNSNHIKYNDWWGWGPVPYCMIFVSWAWLMEGSKAFVKGSRWAGCREMLADALAGGHGIHITNDPDPGCPGVIDLYGDARPDHAITFVKDNGNGTVQTYEANTSKNNTYIQGVWNKTRPAKECWWFEIEK